LEKEGLFSEASKNEMASKSAGRKRLEELEKRRNKPKTIKKPEDRKKRDLEKFKKAQRQYKLLKNHPAHAERVHKLYRAAERKYGAR